MKKLMAMLLFAVAGVATVSTTSNAFFFGLFGGNNCCRGYTYSYPVVTYDACCNEVVYTPCC